LEFVIAGLDPAIHCEPHIRMHHRVKPGGTRKLRRRPSKTLYVRKDFPFMQQDPFVPPQHAFTRSVPIRFSHCDPAGIVYFPHYFNMFNGLIEDWYTEELGFNYAEIIMGSQYGFPFVHIECDFKIPSRMGDVIDLTLLVERIGRSSLGVAVVCHRDGVERLRARMVTAMMSIETRKPAPLPPDLRGAIEAYQARTSS
jgi:4-hydroxybenzoyl-CoA thioesterase